MELDILKLHTTWNDAANSINSNFSKIKMAIASLQEGSGGLNEDELLSFLVNNGYITEEDLSNYYTKYEVNELIDKITAGDIDLANYYTKEQIDDMGFLTSASLVGYATQGYVSEQISKIDLSPYATKLSLSVEAQRIDTLESYFSSGIAKKATADAKGNVIDAYYTPIAMYSNFTSAVATELANRYTKEEANALYAKYLPLSGGTLSNSGANVLTINRTDAYPVIGFSANGTLMGRIGFDTNKAPIVQVSGTYRYIIHTGNVGDYNAGSATKLQTARTIWGQSFDGTGNVSGALSGVTNINSTLYINSSGNVTIGDSNLAGTNYKLYVDGNVAAVASDATPRSFRAQNTNGTISLLSSTNRGVYDSTNSRWLIATDGTNSWLSCGSIGIGTETPEYNLDVNGTVRSNTLRVVNNCYITGSTEIGGRLTMTGTENSTVATIAFSRANANYIVVPSGGSLSIAAGESSLAASVAQFNASGYNLISKGATRVDGALTISGTDSTTARIVYSRAGLNYIGIPADGTLSIGSAYTNTGNVVNISAADKTSAFNGDIILKSASASADTPRLIFQRGTASDDYYDWGIHNTGGALSFKFNSKGTWTQTLRLRSTYIDADVAINSNTELVIKAGTTISFLDASGNKHTMSYDSTKQAFVLDGNVVITGDNASA